MSNSYQIRIATMDDLDQITQLFRETVLHINSKDYSDKQVETWASRSENLNKWRDRIRHQYFVIAVEGQDILGFASVTNEGYLDTIFVHKDHQGEGIGTKLLDKVLSFVEEKGKSEVFTEASLTARPFLEKHGFRTNRPQQKVRDGVVFVNFGMIKSF